MGNCQDQEQHKQMQNQVNYDGQGPVQQLLLNNFSWNQDYQGLFDFDTKQVITKNLKVKGSGILLKGPNTFETVEDKIQKLSQQQLNKAQFKLIKKDNYYLVSPIFYESENVNIVHKLLWVVIQSLPNKVHKLQEKDIVKLGKQKIRIREIALADANNSNVFEMPKLSKLVYENLIYQVSFNKEDRQKDKEKEGKQKGQLKGSLSEITNSQQICRICLDPGEYTNPLITPCKCTGSIRYIHLNCLRSWLAKRLNVQKSPHCVTINWTQLTCEMCKTPFKYRIYMDNKKFYTVDIPKPAKPYIILQLMKKSSANGKIFHFVSFAQKNKIMVGRRKDIDVRISDDISISRAHATIQYLSELKQFQISDNKSKFGTLVLIKKGLIVQPKFKNISIQVGAEIFSLTAVRGPNKGNLQPQNIENTDDYLAQQLSSEDEDEQIEQNQEDQITSHENQNIQNTSNNYIPNEVNNN